MTFAVHLYNKLTRRIEQKDAHEMMKEAVALEREFITEALPCALIGMNAQLMSQYIEFVADRLLIDLGYDPVWNVTCPFDWMVMIGQENKRNFFETAAAGDYAMTGVMAGLQEDAAENRVFRIDADF